jgi:hypothetical protein
MPFLVWRSPPWSVNVQQRLWSTYSQHLALQRTCILVTSMERKLLIWHLPVSIASIFLDELGLKSSLNKDCPPSTNMLCLGVEVNTDTLMLSVPAIRLRHADNSSNKSWSRTHYRLKELQSLLGKLSLVTACIKPSRIFMPCLLANLRAFPPKRASTKVSPDMYLDISWWLEFLPQFNGSSMIKPNVWDFDELHFTTDASLLDGGGTVESGCVIQVSVSQEYHAQHRAYYCIGTLQSSLPFDFGTLSWNVESFSSPVIT